MRVLLVHNYYRVPGGEEVYFESLARLLKQKGHQVELWTKDNRKVSKSPIGRFGIALGLFWNPRVEKELEKVISRFNPEVVHFSNIFPLISPSAYRVCANYRAKVVQTVHSLRYRFPLTYRAGFAVNLLYQLAIWWHRLLGNYSRVSLFIFPSAFARNYYLARRAVVGSKTALIANFIQVPRMPKTAKKDYFLYVGRISDEKGVGTLVKAFGGLDEKLIIVGKGPVLRKLRAGAAHNVKFVGKKPRQTVLKYMSQAKALIVPSEVNEVFPTVILEAYACGTCVIAPARGVFKEMIKEGKTGILYRPGSVGELTRKIIEVDTHDRLRRMSKLAQKEALKYTREGYYDKLIKIYIRAPVT